MSLTVDLVRDMARRLAPPPLLPAVPITLKQAACMAALRRRGQPMGDPATAIERWRELSRRIRDGIQGASTTEESRA